MSKYLIVCLLMTGWWQSQAQNLYRYAVDLRNIKDDQLHITLLPPRISSQETVFHMPKIIPGTYSNSDYGKFVSNFKAEDKNGKTLPVKKLDDNSWQIRNATAVARISYDVEDSWDATIKHEVYSMNGTNIEAGKNIVLNTPGFFGFLAGMTKLPFELTVHKPENFYGSTALIATKSEKDTDVFQLEDADHLYDSPLMYSIPDTTTIKVANTDVLISVYSPKKLMTSAAIAGRLHDLLMATREYLGGKLPVQKYAFIFYFNGEQAPLKGTGALEHNYSSFYALPEMPFDKLGPIVIDICAHEFFHIVTPLTICSEEVRHFNFTKTVLSRHLWLYEGSTEYAAHHAQVTAGITTPEQFLKNLSKKIETSRVHFNDELPFTELSKHSADKYEDQFVNVYQKGALISASLDLYLLKLSGGKYGIRNLIHDLSVKYGKDQFFNDDELFDQIALLTYPAIREFFRSYVEGPAKIPYEKFFGFAGVNFTGVPAPTMGKMSMSYSADGRLMIGSIASMNEFGKRMGYREGDEIVALNGEAVNTQTAQVVFHKHLTTVKDGDIVKVTVLRKDESGEKKEVVLSAPQTMTTSYDLTLSPDPTPEQLMIRNAWLGVASAEAAPATPVNATASDVESVESIINTLYEVISGGSGERNWDRFSSLFYAGAKLGAAGKTPQGEEKVKRITPEEYIKLNQPIFKQFDFVEKELHRETNTYGSISQVFSSYESELKMPQQTVKQRGINSIELIRENGRWWITSLTWNDETPEIQLPAKFTGAPAVEETKAKKNKNK
jgi:predicted metalloprotease with PDZ domain